MRFPAIPLRLKKTCDSRLPPNEGRRRGTVLFYEGINCDHYTTLIDKKATGKPSKKGKSGVHILFTLPNAPVWDVQALRRRPRGKICIISAVMAGICRPHAKSYPYIIARVRDARPLCGLTFLPQVFIIKGATDRITGERRSNMRERLRTYLENSPGVRVIQRAAESEFYPALVCLIVFMAYCSDYEMLFATVLIAFASVTLILFRDLKTLLPPLFMFTFALTLKHAPKRPTYSDYYFQTPVLVSFAILILVLLTALVLHYVIWGGFTAMFRKKTRLTWFILPLTVALLCNGLFAEGYAPINITYSIALVFVWIFLYLVFRFGLSPGEETVRYFTVSCQWTAILLILELFYVYITRDVLVDGIIVEGRIFLGWGINNNYGAAMTILLPALFYLTYTRKNGWVQFLLIVAAFAAIVLSMCRAALLVGAVIFLAGFITGCFYGTNRNLFRLLLGVSLATGAVTLIALRTQIIETFSFLFNLGFSDEGRFTLWRGGIDIFRRYPIFGGGFNAVAYYGLFNSWAGSAMPGMLHNTVIELFCVSGAFGGISYLAYRVRTIQLALWRTNGRRFCLGLMVAAIVGVGMLDNPMFNFYPTFFTTVALVLIEHDYDETMARRTEPAAAPRLDDALR